MPKGERQRRGPYDFYVDDNGKEERYLAQDVLRDYASSNRMSDYSPIDAQKTGFSSANTHLKASSRADLPLDNGGFYGFVAKKGQSLESAYAEALRGRDGNGNPYFVSRDDLDARVRKNMGIEQWTPQAEQEFLNAARGLNTYFNAIQIPTGHAVGNALLEAGHRISSDDEAMRLNAVSNMGGDVDRMRSVWGADAVNEFRQSAAGIVDGDVNVRTIGLQRIGLTAEQVSAVYGAEEAERFKQRISTGLLSGDAEQQKKALQELNIAEEQFRNVLKPEVNTEEGFKMPYLDNLPIPVHMAGFAAAGVGGASLAAYLMAQGQQQQSSVDYGAQVQSLNAY